MRTSNLIFLLSQLGVTEAGNGKVTGGFNWGDWAPWEPCVKVGKKHRRRRVCFGPIQNKKINKRNCENDSTLEGDFIEEEVCTAEMLKQSGLSKYQNKTPMVAKIVALFG